MHFIPFNPCDYLYLAQHRALARRGQGIISQIVAEAQGRVEHTRVRAAVERMLAAHPVMVSNLSVSRMLARPRWRAPADAGAAARRHAAQSILYFDLRNSGSGAEGEWAARVQAGFTAEWDLYGEPLLRFEHYDLPGDRTALVARSPHVLTDAEGGQWMIAELERMDQAPDSDRSERLLPDGRNVDPLAGASFFRRFGLAWGELRRGGGPKFSRVEIPRPAAVEPYGCLHRHWDKESFKRVKDAAREMAPPGPSLYPRHLAAAVICALHRLHVERQIETDVYTITFPRSVSRLAGGADQPTARPFNGNYLVSPLISVARGAAGDRRTVAGLVDDQLRAYQETDGERGQWALTWLFSAMRLGMYDWLVERLLRRVAVTSGYSYYGEISPPPRRLFGLPLINLWGAAPMLFPPGLNPVFSQYRNSLNLSLTWTRPLVTDDLARRFVELIEEESGT